MVLVFVFNRMLYRQGLQLQGQRESNNKEMSIVQK